MTNEMNLFNFKENEVRTVTKDGEPWFVAKDICEYFGDTNYRRSMARLDEDEKGVSQIQTRGGKQSLTVVNEPGLYSLLMLMQPQKGSSLSEKDRNARCVKLEEFKRWVTHDVLPSIRKHGAYMTQDVIKQTIANPDFAIQLLTQLKEERLKTKAAIDEMSNKELIIIHNNEEVVSSRQVAENFERMHKDVLESIREILKAENPALTQMFFESSYKAGTGKSYPEYLMNRDGFTLLTMGFTGSKALKWKLKYIQAFNEMEEHLKNTPVNSQTYKEALVALVEQVGENDQKLIK